MAAYDERFLWIVPSEDAEESGILLCDRIAYYVQTVKLIDPFDFTSLRPAQYDLKVGDAYYSDDVYCKLDEGDHVKIPRNGLVFIKTRETFNVPYYMIGRYSLRVSQVYRGLLVDNGLQVDPGYHGPIWVPVHNLTSEDRVLKFGETFLSIEFTKTTSFCPQKVGDIKSENQLIAKREEVRGIDGRALVLFVKDVKDLGKPKGPPELWLKGEKHMSSTFEMNERLKQVEMDESRLESRSKELKTELETQSKELEGRYERFRNFSYVALAALFLSFFFWFSARYSELLSKTEQALSNSTRTMNVHQMQDEISQLRARIADLEARSNQGKEKPKAPATTQPSSK